MERTAPDIEFPTLSVDTTVEKPKSKRGGRRIGAGRKKASHNQMAEEAVATMQANGDLTPLQFILDIMRNTAPANATPTEQITFANMRFEAAKAAAPYLHPKLQAIEMTGKNGKDLVPAEKQPVGEIARRVAFLLRKASKS